jgi:hypothetical protein
MSGEPRCFNCGAATDLVTDAGDAICRTCHDARQAPVEAEVAKPKAKSRAKPKGAKRGAKG